MKILSIGHYYRIKKLKTTKKCELRHIEDGFIQNGNFLSRKMD